MLVKYDATYVVPAVIATGLEKSSSCHPDAVSLLNVPLASNGPEEPQAPGMRPRIGGLLVEPHPGDKPAARAWNFRPMVCALGSFDSTRPPASRHSRCCTGTSAR